MPLIQPRGMHIVAKSLVIGEVSEWKCFVSLLPCPHRKGLAVVSIIMC